MRRRRLLARLVTVCVVAVLVVMAGAIGRYRYLPDPELRTLTVVSALIVTYLLATYTMSTRRKRRGPHACC